MRLIHGVLGLLMLSGGAAQAGWPCDICICPRVMLSYDPLTDESFWECEEHTCESDCDCGPGPIVYRYYSGEQYEGECSFDCQVYCEQIVISLFSSPSAAPPASAPAATAADADDKTEAEAKDAKAAPVPVEAYKANPGKVKRKSRKLKQPADATKPDLDNYELTVNKPKSNPHIKKAEVDATTVCYLPVKSDVGGDLIIKLMKVTFTRKDDDTTFERRIGYEVIPQNGQTPCTTTTVKIEHIQASQETEINNTNAPVHVVDGLYKITVDGDAYLVRTKNDLDTTP